MQYDVLTIDTQVIEHHGFNFDGGLLSQLKQFSGGPTKVVLSQVVVAEVRNHLLKHSEDVHTALETAHRKALKLGLLSDPSAPQPIPKTFDLKLHVDTRLKNFIKEIGAEIVPWKEIDLEHLMKRYFSAAAPFGAAKGKKNEFPDAIALLSMESWAQSRGYRVLAVSDDNDWASFGAQSEVIDVEKDLATALATLQLHLEAADTAVQSLLDDVAAGARPDIVERFESQLTDALADVSIPAEADSAFYLEEEQSWLTLEECQLPSGQAASYKIVRAGPEQLVISLELEPTVSAEATFSLSIRDSIDKDYIGMGSVTLAHRTTIAVSALMTFDRDIDAGTLALSAVEIDSAPDSIDFGYVEPDFRDEE